MAVSISWSIVAHKKETKGNNYIGNVEWCCTASEGSNSGFTKGHVILDRPETVKPYATFLGIGNTALVAAVKAKLGATEVTAQETAAEAELTKVATPTHEWVQGPA
jgi:predicted nicotinamide N-methyase